VRLAARAWQRQHTPPARGSGRPAIKERVDRRATAGGALHHPSRIAGRPPAAPSTTQAASPGDHRQRPPPPEPSPLLAQMRDRDRDRLRPRRRGEDRACGAQVLMRQGRVFNLAVCQAAVRLPGHDAAHQDRGIPPAVPTTGRGPRSCLVHNGPPASARNARNCRVACRDHAGHDNGQATFLAQSAATRSPERPTCGHAVSHHYPALAHDDLSASRSWRGRPTPGYRSRAATTRKSLTSAGGTTSSRPASAP
jgi:hypothetical protein